MEFEAQMFELSDGRRVRIRRCVPGDARASSVFIAQLADEAPYIGMNPGETPTADKCAQRLQEVSERPGSIAICAEPVDQPGLIVGDLQMLAYSREKTRHVAIIGMGILEAWAGAGLGRALLTRCVEWARAHPALLRIELGVMSSNTGAVRLYESLGFVHEGRSAKRFRQPDGSFEDDIFMGLWGGGAKRDLLVGKEEEARQGAVGGQKP